MRRFFVAFVLAAAGLIARTPATPAHADILVTVSKASQSMSVVVDGRERYRWPVSTGTGGGPPSGTYRPERLERTWYSRRYDWSPMPHAIFFHHGLNALIFSSVTELAGRLPRFLEAENPVILGHDGP